MTSVVGRERFLVLAHAGSTTRRCRTARAARLGASGNFLMRVLERLRSAHVELAAGVVADRRGCSTRRARAASPPRRRGGVAAAAARRPAGVRRSRRSPAAAAAARGSALSSVCCMLEAVADRRSSPASSCGTRTRCCRSTLLAQRCERRRDRVDQQLLVGEALAACASACVVEPAVGRLESARRAG